MRLGHASSWMALSILQFSLSQASPHPADSAVSLPLTLSTPPDGGLNSNTTPASSNTFSVLQNIGRGIDAARRDPSTQGGFTDAFAIFLDFSPPTSEADTLPHHMSIRLVHENVGLRELVLIESGHHWGDWDLISEHVPTGQILDTFKLSDIDLAPYEAADLMDQYMVAQRKPRFRWERIRCRRSLKKLVWEFFPKYRKGVKQYMVQVDMADVEERVRIAWI